MMKEFDIDKELQSIADKITEHDLSYGGAHFEHLPTGEDFTITVAKSSKLRKMSRDNRLLKDRVKEIEDVLSTIIVADNMIRNGINVHGGMAMMIGGIDNAKELLEESND